VFFNEPMLGGSNEISVQLGYAGAAVMRRQRTLLTRRAMGFSTAFHTIRYG
jgi:hypothetical protein